MADPFRLKVMKALTDAIKQASVSEGFSFDLGDTDLPGNRKQAHVFRGRTEFGESDPLPVVSILEAPKQPDGVEARSSSIVRTDWELLIQGFVRDDKDNPTDPAYLLSADVVRLLAAEKKKEYGGGAGILGLGVGTQNVFGLVIGEPVHRPADGETSSQAHFYLPVILKLVEDRENPFA